jgi:hypothetical protein
MGLEVDATRAGEGEVDQNDYLLEEDLFKTEDGRVVRAGTGEAAFVYRSAGQRIPTAEARELGLIGKPKKADKPADKKRSTAKNKQKG